MIRIPEGDYDFQVRGIEIEGGNDPGVDVQYPWEDAPRRFHHHRIHIAGFYIDRTPVTNAEFKRFLDAADYHPAGRSQFPARLEKWHVSRRLGEKACDLGFHRGCPRLRQLGGQASAARMGMAIRRAIQPMGALSLGQRMESASVPAPDRGRTMRPPADVDAFPQGASPLGVLDLEGNVSQWTDEFRDPHTRAAILRGGAAYQPTGSIWYFPQTYRLMSTRNIC